MLTTKSKELNDAEKEKDVVSKNLVRVRKEIEQNETKKNEIIDQIEERETMASKFYSFNFSINYYYLISFFIC